VHVNHLDVSESLSVFILLDVFTMSGGVDALALKEEDVTKFLACGTHLGTQNTDYQMVDYIYKRKPDGIHIINLRKTWEKLLFAARAIVAIENPADVCAISSKEFAQRAVLKFAYHTGATPVAGRYTPGTFTNQVQAAFREPRLLVVTDPRMDHQAVTESAYVNIPVIAFSNTDSPVRYVDIAIPCNNQGPQSVGLMWWLLTREVLRLRGTISRDVKWDVMVDLYFYRDQEEVEKEEQAAQDRAIREAPEITPAAPVADQWAGDEPAEWVEGAPAAPTIAYQPAPQVQDWSATTQDEWVQPEVAAPVVAAAPAPAQPSNWGGAQNSGW